MIEVILTLILIVVIFFVAAFLFKGEEMTALLTGKAKDLTQQKAAASALASAKTFAAMEQYKVVSPIHIAINGKFADDDFAIVGKFGVLCVKCIGLGGEIYSGEGDGDWLQVIGDERKNFANPLISAAADTRAVREALFDAKIKNVPVETICVFTNKKAQLVVPRNAGHYTLKSFKQLIGKDKYLQDKKVDIQKVADILKSQSAS